MQSTPRTHAEVVADFVQQEAYTQVGSNASPRHRRNEREAANIQRTLAQPEEAEEEEEEEARKRAGQAVKMAQKKALSRARTHPSHPKARRKETDDKNTRSRRHSPGTTNRCSRTINAFCWSRQEKRTGDRAEGLRDGSTDDVDTSCGSNSVCRQAKAHPPTRPGFDDFFFFQKLWFSRADWRLRGAHGGRVQPDTVVPHSRSRKQFKVWRAGKVQAAAVERDVARGDGMYQAGVAGIKGELRPRLAWWQRN